MTNESSATSKQFNQLIAALGTDLELTGEEIADIIWFSQKREEVSNTPNDTTSQAKNQSNASERLNPPTNTSEKLNPPPINTPESNLTPTNTQASLKPLSVPISLPTQEKIQAPSKTKALPLRVPDAPSLREPLKLIQALKPLMRRVESGRKTVLDETATAEHTAALRICIPILKSELEPWLDVALVVDESKSMLIWRHTIWEFKKLLENYGVFRDVRAWGLVTDENGQIYIRPGIGKNAHQQRLASHREILDPNRRRLILLVSDCVAAIWRNGAITQVLKDWTNTQPVAIIQMLPNWLWLKTGLGLGASVNLGSLTPGVANKHLLVKKQLLWKDINLDTGIKIPVLTLEADTALPWSQMLAGKSDVVASGFVLSSAISSQIKPNPNQQTQTTPQKVNASERVYRFRMTASPMGRKLAELLAAAPVINLPVVRLIQETLLPKSRQVHVAEVFLAGLLKPLTPIEADTPPDTVQYDFMDDEIRGMLLEDAPVKDSTDVFDAVSQYVAAQLGKSLQDFVALLKAPGEADEQVKPFAEVAVKILKRLGGEYAAFAEELEQKLPDMAQYDFMDDEIRGMLLEAAPVKDSADTFNVVTHMAYSESLNEQINRLATEVCQHPQGSLNRQRLLNQLIYQMQQSGKIWLGGDIISQYYKDALQQTWFWFCKNINKYNASQANVITWFNAHLKFRLLDIRQQVAIDNRTRATKSENEELNFIDPVDNLPAPEEPQPILEETLEWIETQGSELRRLHVRSSPHINCQVLLKHKLPPDAKTWRELAEKFGERESTLQHFYNRKCLPCLLAFGRTQGYIDT